MAKINAVANVEIKANRCLKVSVNTKGLPTLMYAVGGYPHFRSAADLEEGQETVIKILNNNIWKVTAGEDLYAGQAVYSGEEGKLFSRKTGEKRPVDLIGYVTSDTKIGDTAELVRSFQINGNWALEVTNELNITNNPEPEEPTEE